MTDNPDGMHAALPVLNDDEDHVHERTSNFGLSNYGLSSDEIDEADDQSDQSDGEGTFNSVGQNRETTKRKRRTSFKASTKNNTWTQEMKWELAKLAFKHQVGVKIQNLSEAAKAALLQADFIKKFPIAGVEGAGLVKQLTRDKKWVLEKYGITDAGANLSGLDETERNFVTLHIDMARKQERSKINIANKKKGKLLTQKAKNSVEQSGLRSQGAVENIPISEV